MAALPKPKTSRARALFSDTGERTAKLSLFQEVFYDRTERALKIIETDPEQINLVDPFAGLTSLHVAIFRQNVDVVEAIAAHPVADLTIRDKFDRRPSDMCIYTRNDRIYSAVFERTYREEILDLDSGGGNLVVTFKPKA